MADALDPLSELRDDHSRLMNSLSSLEKLVSHVPDPGSIEKISSLLTSLTSQLMKHHEREELGLFPVLKKYLGGELGPIPVMEGDHCALRGAREEAVTCLKALDVGYERDVAAQLRTLCLKLVGLLRNHISKEENVLFWVARINLTDDDKKSIFKILREIDLRPE